MAWYGTCIVDAGARSGWANVWCVAVQMDGRQTQVGLSSHCCCCCSSLELLEPQLSNAQELVRMALAHCPPSGLSGRETSHFHSGGGAGSRTATIAAEIAPNIISLIAVWMDIFFS